MPGCGLPPAAVVSALAVSPLPTLIVAVATFEACVLAAGKGGGSTVNPAKVHCAIVNPQMGAGVAGALFTVSVSVAKLPVSKELINR